MEYIDAAHETKGYILDATEGLADILLVSTTYRGL